MANRSWVVTPEELQRGELFQVGWYPAEIVKYEDGEAGERAKNPGSATANFTWKILDGPGKGVEIRRTFSETAWQFAKTFFAAIGFPKDEKGNYKISSDLFQQTVGHRLEVYVGRRKADDGNEYSDIKDFRPIR